MKSMGIGNSIREKNCNLAYQIKEDLLNQSDIMNYCSQNANGEMEFLVRNYLLQKTSFIKRNTIIENYVELNDDASKEMQGMCQDTYKKFVTLLSRNIRNSEENFHYCSIIVNYQTIDSQYIQKIEYKTKQDRHHKRI